MRTEYAIDLVFMRESGGETPFGDDVEAELGTLFAGLGHWALREKTADGADIVVAEVKGRNAFADGRGALTYIETCGSDRFWSWLQGYRIETEPLAEGCGCCREQEGRSNP